MSREQVDKAMLGDFLEWLSEYGIRMDTECWSKWQQFSDKEKLEAIDMYYTTKCLDKPKVEDKPQIGDKYIIDHDGKHLVIIESIHEHDDYVMFRVIGHDHYIDDGRTCGFSAGGTFWSQEKIIEKVT